jgi:uncharacterized protein YyaL (SSP411 family)
MLHHITPHFVQYPMAYANWGTLMIKMTEPFFEVVITGENAEHIFKEMQDGFYPNVLWAFSKNASEVPILKDRFSQAKTLIYVCRGGVCQLPVESVPKAIEMILISDK